MAPPGSIGYTRELKCEMRLRELGYEVVCRPAREDAGVDFSVFTSTGWQGLQVKSAHEKDGRLRCKLGESLRGSRGKSYYAYRGVTAFAVFWRDGFYVIPIDEADERRIDIRKDSRRWEAWTDVIGLPIGSTSRNPSTCGQSHIVFGRRDRDRLRQLDLVEGQV